MKDLREALINKNSIKHIIHNKYNIKKDDLIGDLERFPLGVVIRMLEEQEKQGNKADVKVFQEDSSSDARSDGFTWDETDDGYDFWCDIIENEKFNTFYKRYPDYKTYNR